MDRQQIREQNGSHLLLGVRTDLLGVGHHRDRCGKALISASRYDHHRHFAPAHAGVRSGGGRRSETAAEVLGSRIPDRPSDARAPAVLHALLSDRAVVLHLPRKQCANLREIAAARIIQNALHRQERAVGKAAFPPHFRLILRRQSLSILFDSDNIGVEVANFDLCRMSLRIDLDLNVEDRAAPACTHLDGAALQKRRNVCLLPLRYAADDLQLPLGLPCRDARRSRGRDPLEAIGIGDNDALRVFYDVSADGYLYAGRGLA